MKNSKTQLPIDKKILENNKTFKSKCGSHGKKKNYFKSAHHVARLSSL